MRPWKPCVPKRPLRDSRGFTLVEILVAVSTLTLTSGLVGTAIFQSLSTQRSWQDDVVATREWRNAQSWFSADALNTETTDLVDGAPAAPAATISWIDDSEVSHTATYAVSSGDLVRDFDGIETTVARRVVSAGFSLAGRTLTFDLVVKAEQGGTETSSLQTYTRALQ